MKNKNEIYLNQPIAHGESDAISIEAYVNQLEKAIKLGAKSIAITSDFGAGKSSLVKILEKKKQSLFCKFCYVNMWSHLTENCNNIELHKTFIYQLANQISKKKGQYVSKRINENYGLFNIRANSTTKQIWLIISMFLIIAGFAFTEFYEKYTSIVFSSDFFKNHNTELGIISFALAALIVLFLIFTTDIVFSSNKSDTKNRKIDENEIMDIYNSYILKRRFRLRKYIVVIEDLDRTENYNAVMQFLKELRKYYIADKSNIVFIVNIKPEGIINQEEKLLEQNSKNVIIADEETEPENNNDDETQVNLNNNSIEKQEIFPKVFDYILDLKTINYLNYDKILVYLLKEKEKHLSELGLSIWKDVKQEELISDFEWIILSRNRNIGIREIKERLNYSISTYDSLKSKFPTMQVSYKKCAVAAYLQSAYSYEYYSMISVGIDKVLDTYAQDKDIISEDFQVQLKHLFYLDDISLHFAEDLLRILKNKCIEEDYRNYYYNIPKNSSIYNADELKFINTLVYSKDSDFITETSWQELSELVNNVKIVNEGLLKETIQKLDKLSLDYPLCILLNEDLLEVALKTTNEKVWNALKKLDYKNDFLKTKSFLFRILSYNKEFNDSSFKVSLINNVLLASQKDIVIFRSELRDSNLISFEYYKMLYFEDFPLITVGEIKSAKNILESLSLINYESQELNYDTFLEINDAISKTYIYNDQNHINTMIDFYLGIIKKFEHNDEPSIDVEMMTYMKNNNIFIEKLFNKIEINSSDEELYEIFIELVNNYAETKQSLPKYILDIIDANNTTEGLNRHVCIELFNAGLYDLYVRNMIAGNLISSIEYANKEVIKTINQYDEVYISKNLFELRQGIILSGIDNLSVYDLFSSKYSLISRKLLFLISNTEKALKIIPAVLIDEDNFEYICQYFNRKGASSRTTYLILKFIVSIKDTTIKKMVFESIDFKKVHYNLISVEKKKEIINGISDIYDFTKSSGMIDFMTITRVSNEDFEEYILKLDNKKSIAEKYVAYVKNLLVLNNRVIQVLLKLPYYYGFNSTIQNEFYKRKYYKYYVISKTLFDKYFTFEREKVNILGSVYFDIFTTTGNFDDIIQKMSKTDVVDYFIQEKLYETVTDEDVLLRFAQSNKQTVSILNYIKDNFDLEFIVIYYSNILGFDGYESAKAFVEIMETNPNIAKQNSIYEQTHEKLINGELKFKYTIAKRRARKKENA